MKPGNQNDPLDALRAAWKAHNPPAPAGDLEACDSTTKAVVRRLQEEWGQAAPAPQANPDLTEFRARLERNGILRKRRPMRRFAIPMVALAAALLIWVAIRNQASPSIDAPSGASGQDDKLANMDPQTIQSKAPSAPAGASVPKVHLRKDGFEMRSGAVRLVLIDPNIHQDPKNPTDT